MSRPAADGATPGVYVAVFPIEQPMPPARLRREAMLQLAGMLGPDVQLTGGDWTWHVTTSTAGTRYLVARHGAATTSPVAADAEARALADRVRGLLPAMASWIDSQLQEAPVCA